MREEYQKTIILLSIIFIFGGLYVSSFFDVGSARHNNTFLFMILWACFLVGYIQTKKIKRWKEEKKTDYVLVYWSYIALTVFLSLYLSYMVVTRSDLECMRIIKINATSNAYKIYNHGSNTWNNLKNNGLNLKGLRSKVGGADIGSDSGSDIGGDMGSSSIGSSDSVLRRMTSADTISYLLKGYKKIWRKMLFMKDPESV